MTFLEGPDQALQKPCVLPPGEYLALRVVDIKWGNTRIFPWETIDVALLVSTSINCANTSAPLHSMGMFPYIALT